MVKIHLNGKDYEVDENSDDSLMVQLQSKQQILKKTMF